MAALVSPTPPDSPGSARALAPAEERIVLYGVRWKDYVIAREALESGTLRMTFCEGTLELMSPSKDHELWKKGIARLVELYALELDVPLNGYGSTTFRREAKQRGTDPDECYRVGTIMKDGEVPDIVIEVIYSRPAIDKLHVYAGLQVPEVWLFDGDAFGIYHLVDGAYARVNQSPLLPALDFSLLTRLATREDQHQAVRELRAILRK